MVKNTISYMPTKHWLLHESTVEGRLRYRSIYDFNSFTIYFKFDLILRDEDFDENEKHFLYDSIKLTKIHSKI